MKKLFRDLSREQKKEARKNLGLEYDLTDQLRKMTEGQARMIWNEKDLEKKKGLLIEFIKRFRFQSKKQEFIDKIKSATTHKRVNDFCTNIYFIGLDMKMPGKQY